MLVSGLTVMVSMAGMYLAARLAIWPRVITAVTRRPKLWGGLAATVLVAMAIPATGMDLGNPPMADSLPKDEPVVQTFNHVREAFPAESSGVSVVLKAHDVSAPAVQRGPDQLEQLAARQPRLFPGDGLGIEMNDDHTVATADLEIAGDGSNCRWSR